MTEMKQPNQGDFKPGKSDELFLSLLFEVFFCLLLLLSAFLVFAVDLVGATLLVACFFFGCEQKKPNS